MAGIILEQPIQRDLVGEFQARVRVWYELQVQVPTELEVLKSESETAHPNPNPVTSKTSSTEVRSEIPDPVNSAYLHAQIGRVWPTDRMYEFCHINIIPKPRCISGVRTKE